MLLDKNDNNFYIFHKVKKINGRSWNQHLNLFCILSQSEFLDSSSFATTNPLINENLKHLQVKWFDDPARSDLLLFSNQLHDTYQYQLPDIKILTVCRLTFGLSKLKHTQTHVFGHNHSDNSYLSKNAEITLTTKIIQEYIDIKLLYMNINIFRLFNGTKTITSISWSELIHIPLPPHMNNNL